MGKACIFVDGENLRHALVKSFDGNTDFKQHDYLPPKANWTEFFDWIVESATSGKCTRLRTYWYVIDRVEYHPHSLNKMEDEPIKKLLSQHEQYKDALKELNGSRLSEKIKRIVDEIDKERSNFQKRFDGWQTIQRNISTKHQAIEFRKSGTIRYDCVGKQLGQEKTVDVKLAVDAVMLRNIYDTAIILSGDQDYVPAAQVLKDSGKTVINVAFEKRNGELLPGGARHLNAATDSSYNIKYDKLMKHLGVVPVERTGMSKLKELVEGK